MKEGLQSTPEDAIEYSAENLLDAMEGTPQEVEAGENSKKCGGGPGKCAKCASCASCKHC